MESQEDSTHFIRARRGKQGLVAYGQTVGVYPFGFRGETAAVPLLYQAGNFSYRKSKIRRRD